MVMGRVKFWRENVEVAGLSSDWSIEFISR
jgi:hypothetical protein